MASKEFIEDSDEVEKSIPGKIGELQSILKNVHGLEVSNEYIQLMERCLRQKDGDLTGAAKLVKGFHVAASNLVTWEASFSPSCYRDYYERGVVQMMKNRDAHGRPVFIIRAALWDPTIENFETCVAGTLMAYLYASAIYTDLQRNGFVTVWDFSGFSLQHFLAVKQGKLVSFLGWVHTGIIGKMKEFHGINHPKVVSILFSLVRPFIKEKLRERMHFHSNVDGLRNVLGNEIVASILKEKKDISKWADLEFLRDLLDGDKYFAGCLLITIMNSTEYASKQASANLINDDFIAKNYSKVKKVGVKWKQNNSSMYYTIRIKILKPV